MFVSKIILLFFVLYQYHQFQVCESKLDVKSTSLVTNVRASKLLKTRHHLEKLVSTGTDLSYRLDYSLLTRLVTVLCNIAYCRHWMAAILTRLRVKLEVN